jgi:DNA-binding response OmpR family regulator
LRHESLRPPDGGGGAIARILVLEDDPRTRQFLSDAISGVLKHEVLAASSLREALSLCGQGPMDFMLLDQRLGDGTAMDFCLALPEASRSVPKMLLTGEKPLDFDEVVWGAMGVRGFLVKPVGVERLMDAIATCLGFINS